MPPASAFVILALMSAAPSASAAPSSDALLQAVRKGDVAAVKAALDSGIPTDAKFRYDRTALSFAADRGQADIVTLLLDRGAEVNAKDTFYGATALLWAAQNGHAEVAGCCWRAGRPAPPASWTTASRSRAPTSWPPRSAAASSPPKTSRSRSRMPKGHAAADIAAALRTAGAVPLPKADFAVDAATLARYAGRYREGGAPSPLTIDLSVVDGVLQASFGGPPVKLGAVRCPDVPAARQRADAADVQGGRRARVGFDAEAARPRALVRARGGARSMKTTR